MGIWKKLVSFRLDEPHLDLLREVGAMCDPPSANLSFNLRVLLNGFWAFLITGRMPRWMAELQGKHRGTVSDSVGQISLLPSPKSEADARAEGRSQFGLGAEAAKRPPRRYVKRPTDRAGLAVSGLAAGGAWLAPFCGFRRNFATTRSLA